MTVDLGNLDTLFDVKEKTETARIDIGKRGDFFEVKYVDNKKYLAELDRLGAEGKKRIKYGTNSKQKNMNDMAVSFCRHLLVDFQLTLSKKIAIDNFPKCEFVDTKEEGLVRAVYNFKNSYELLRHEKMFPLLQSMIDESAKEENFTKSNFEEDSKNLKPLPSIKQNTQAKQAEHIK